MALSREKKTEVLAEVSQLLGDAKMTVIAKYEGTSVKSMQQLREEAAGNGTKVKVIKNRLFKRALAADNRFTGVDNQVITGQLLYAFNREDEVAPAQSLAAAAQTEPQITFVAGISADGKLLSAEDVAALASLPSKEQLRSQLAGIIAAPLSGFTSVLAGNVRGVLNVLNARSEQIN